MDIENAIETIVKQLKEIDVSFATVKNTIEDKVNTQPWHAEKVFVLKENLSPSLKARWNIMLGNKSESKVLSQILSETLRCKIAGYIGGMSHLAHAKDKPLHILRVHLRFFENMRDLTKNYRLFFNGRDNNDPLEKLLTDMEETILPEINKIINAVENNGLCSSEDQRNQLRSTIRREWGDGNEHITLIPDEVWTGLNCLETR